MMGRTVPLIVNVLVTALAGIRLHEELAGNLFTAVDLRGTGEKRAGGAVAFSVHGEGRQPWIFNPRMLVPTSFAKVASNRRKHHQHREDGGNANSGMTRQPSEIAEAGRGNQSGTEKTHPEVDINERPLRPQRSGVNQHQPWDCAEE